MVASSIARRDLVALTLAAAASGRRHRHQQTRSREFAPVTLLSLQLAASLATLAVLARITRTSLRGSPSLLSRSGLLNPGLAYALSLVGLVTVSASLSVMLWALEPLLILALAAAFLGERITPAFVSLSLIAVVGMILVLYEPAAGGQLVGIALTVAGVVMLRGVHGDHPPVPAWHDGLDSAGRLWPAGLCHRLRTHGRRRSRRRRSTGRAGVRHADRARERSRLGRPVLRRGLLVLSVGAALGARVIRGGLVLLDPDLRVAGAYLLRGREAGRPTMGRRRHRPRCRVRDACVRVVRSIQQASPPRWPAERRSLPRAGSTLRSAINLRTPPFECRRRSPNFLDRSSRWRKRNR